MKRYTIALIISLFALSAFSQSAKSVLDKTVASLEKAGGIKAVFDIQVSENNHPAGSAKGTILLDGDKFMLETSEATTWFDGETQWSYMTGSGEVNISNPTEEELQSINPYALLSLYKDNYTSKMGQGSTYRGKPIYEVVLSTKDKKKEITKLNVYIDKATYQPLFIVADLRDGSKNEIVINEYKTGLKHSKSVFVFDSAKYPDLEIIDLR